MDFRCVLAIDAGLRNFAYCKVDSQNWRQPLAWRQVDLWAPHPNRRVKPTEHEFLEIAHAWFQQNSALFEDVDVVIFERQIRAPFKIMNAVLQTLCFEKHWEVGAMTVAAFWNLPKTRAAKKAAGVEIVKQFAEIPPSYNGKEDDMADAWLMAVYALVQRRGLSKISVSLKGEESSQKKCRLI